MTTHACTNHPTFNTWRWVMRRCYDAHCKCYANYGGRGIKVCEQWHDPRQFIDDMGEKPVGKTLDRIDNNGDYSPENCRWVTYRQQANNRRDNRRLTYKGKQQTIAEWGRELEIPASVISWRVCHGWSDYKALSKPYNFRHKQLTYNGKTQSMKQWADELNMPYACLKQRIRSGWSVEDALTKQRQVN